MSSSQAHNDVFEERACLRQSATFGRTLPGGVEETMTLEGDIRRDVESRFIFSSTANQRHTGGLDSDSGIASTRAEVGSRPAHVEGDVRRVTTLVWVVLRKNLVRKTMTPCLNDRELSRFSAEL